MGQQPETDGFTMQQKQYSHATGTGKTVEVDHVLGIVEAILGEEAKGQVQSALEVGLTPDQLQQAQALFSGPESRGKDKTSRQEILEATWEAHGETGVQARPEDPSDGKGGLSSDAQRRAHAAGEAGEPENVEE